MKSKYGFWKLCLNSLAGLAGLAGLVGLTGCKELTCDFSYSPTTPAAGSVVTFSNKSTGADDYYWNFGDNGTSSTSSPTHIYRKPGTYTVTLQIVRNKVEKRSRTQHITIIDTIPTIACDTDSVYAFTPTTFKAQVYNPWKKTINYTWSIPTNAVVIAGKSLDSSAIVCYFNQSGVTRSVQLNLQMDQAEAVTAQYETELFHQNGPSVIYTRAGQTYEQFYYTINKQRVFAASTLSLSAENEALLQKEQDTLYHYGDTLFTIARVQALLKKEIKGFQTDRLTGNIYAYGDGMWVCSMSGKNSKTLLATPVTAIKVDGAGNRVYWSDSTGLYCHRLLNTQFEQSIFVPDTVNQQTAIKRISVNSNLH